MSFDPPNLPLLLHTKLRRPRAIGQIIRRPQLLDLLGAGLALPLTALLAPAGYGKSTLVGLWLDEVDVPWAWYSIGAQDNALSVFAQYLAAALATAYPGTGAAVNALLQSPVAPPPELLADALIGELLGLPGEVILVLDDYHTIDEPDVHRLVTLLIQNAPAGVHFVLLSRTDPPLKLARLRGHQQVLEIRAAQLRFSPGEASELMERVLGKLATTEVVAMVAERTEGWPAGFHLAAVSMRESHDPYAFASAFASTGGQLIFDYLVSEVLEGLPPQESKMLLYASILPRFCAPLCDAILPQEGRQVSGEAFLSHLRRSNLFLIALDNEGTWYRFHHLFGEILFHHLGLTVDAAAIAEMHVAASKWFDANGYHEEAITHALAAGDAVAAARIVEANVDALLNAEHWRTLEHWLTQLPPPMLERPALLVARAWIQQFHYRPTPILALTNDAEAGLEHCAVAYPPGEEGAIWGSIHTLRALAYLFLSQYETSVRSAEEALWRVPKHRIFARGLAELIYVRALLHLGRHAEAMTLALTWIDEQVGAPNSRTFRLLLAQCGNYYDLFELQQMKALATSYRRLAEQAGTRLSAAWASYMLGFAHYQRGEVAEAHACFAEVVRHPYEAHTRAVIDSTTGLALCLRAQGRHDEALDQAAQLRNHLVQSGLVELAVAADVLEQYLQILSGQPVQVNDHFGQNLAAQLGLDFWLLPVQVWLLAHIYSGTPAKLAAASAKLAEYRALAAFGALPRRMLELHLLEARLCTEAGDHRTARRAVQWAVTATQRVGAVRCFVDVGPLLRPYLQELAHQGVEAEHIGRILAVFPVSPGTEAARSEPAAPLAATSAELLGPDALTNREVDVLVLLAARFSNKEIAEQLYISPFTVKRHTIAIYQKLHVDSRRAAVARARAMGLLPAS